MFFKLQNQASDSTGFRQRKSCSARTTGTDLVVLLPVVSSVFLSPLITSVEKAKSIGSHLILDFRCFSRQLLKKKASEFAKISISDAFRARSARKKHQNSQKSQFLMLSSPASQEKSIRIRKYFNF